MTAAANLQPCQGVYSELGADPDLAELVELFVSEMPDRVALLNGQFAERQWEQLRRTAHQLKGAAGSYGFGGITPLAARLEQAAADPVEEQIEQSLAELTALMSSVRAGRPQ